ncbi:MAG: aminotransferase class I/II-fold pyridoxal phosphate-dependent enzyme [Chitinophagaceae bacterium]|nr:aminotransferase class I/II-fold pyridoxal phosphate-dependent enzyme [Chitinophagaceae bacterium]
MIIDFRSDTVTKPTPHMLEAMQSAKIGDDVFGEDPTVNALELFSAQLFEKEAALLCPSGTMTNQIAIKCHTQPAEEVICDRQSHIYQYEGGGIAFNAGCQVKLIEGNRGRINADQVEQAINPDDIHKAKTTLVSLENTSNRGGGSCYDVKEIQKIKAVCEKNNLKLHLDGARLFNALVARKESAPGYGKLFDSISICLSKSLGAPVGSLLLGKKDFIQKARRIRKIFGGGMRQAGYLAAAGLYALNNNINRLQEDHKHAKYIAGLLQKADFVNNMLPVETNIIIFEVKPDLKARDITENLKAKNILAIPISERQIRFVFHLDITPKMVDYTGEVIQQL